MKVIITDAQKQEYRKFFQDLQEFWDNTKNQPNSGLAGIDLTIYNPEKPDDLRLPILYQALDTLLKNNYTPHNKFFRLPLDEPYFKVDMNTRAITVPSEFSNNGLGVIGDANAELVFFEVARLYDAVDLYGLVQKSGHSGCWIQWQNTASGASGNSKAIFTDVLEKDGEEVMYLGWLITSDMTSRAGALEFSIRFFDVTNDTNGDPIITYSISTQKASCPIKTTLNLDVLDTEVEDMTDIIYTRPIYSGVLDSLSGSSARLVLDLTPGEHDLVTTGAVYNKYYDPEDEEINDAYGDTYKNGVYELKVVAESPDGGTISYQWYKGGNIIADADTESGIYAANTAGTYSARIGNTKANTGTRWSQSSSVVIPAAREIQFSRNHSWPLGIYSDGTNSLTVDVCDIDSQNAANGTLQYTWTKKNLAFVDGHTVVASGAGSIIAGATTATYTPAIDEEGAYTCSIVNYRNNTTSNPIVTERQAIVRAEPDAPASITLHYDEGTKTLSVPEVNFPAGSPSANHRDEWQYQWTNNIYGNISAANGGNNPTFNIANYPVNSDNSTDYTFNCEVRHVIWDDNVGGERRASVATLAATPIRVHISMENGVRTIVQK